MPEVRRKLSKNMRRCNLAYKIIMAVIGGANVALANFAEVPEIYFKVFSVLGVVFPLVWSNILDGCKEYEEQATPIDSPNSPSSMHSQEVLSQDVLSSE